MSSERGNVGPLRSTRHRHGAGDGPKPERVVSPDSLARVLLATASRALRGEDCADLGYRPVQSRFRGAPEPVRRAAAARAAVPAEQVAGIDVEHIARWIVAHYPPRWYPGVVVGSPHGAAVHLATAMGVPWLPAAFETNVHWPDGAVDDAARALSYGSALTASLGEENPGLHVRQVHDPAGRGPLAGVTVALTVRWRRLPEAYRRFLGARLAPGAPVLLLCDTRTWPVFDAGSGHSFQVGSPGCGLAPEDFLPDSEPFGRVLRGAGGEPARWDIPSRSCGPRHAEYAVEPGFEEGVRAWARGADSPLHRILFTDPEALSAAAADVYRDWLRSEGKKGDRCVVECGRLIDPWQVVRAGLVPYWCESSTERSVTGAEWWLAGSASFDSIDVLPESPGVRVPGTAGLPQWLAVASFARRGEVDRFAARGYPVNPVPTRHATEVLGAYPCDLPVPAPLRPADALAGLGDGRAVPGLTVC